MLFAVMVGSGHASVRLLASYARARAEATRRRMVARPGLVRQRGVHPGVEDQWVQMGTAYQRGDLAQHVLLPGGRAGPAGPA
jgi:hypothetical protein